MILINEESFEEDNVMTVDEFSRMLEEECEDDDIVSFDENAVLVEEFTETFEEGNILAFAFSIGENVELSHVLVENAADGRSLIWLKTKKSDKFVDQNSPLIVLIKSVYLTHNGADAKNNHAANVKFYCNAFRGNKNYSEENGFQVIADPENDKYEDYLELIPSVERKVVKKFIEDEIILKYVNKFYFAKPKDEETRKDAIYKIRTRARVIGIKVNYYDNGEPKED